MSMRRAAQPTPGGSDHRRRQDRDRQAGDFLRLRCSECRTPLPVQVPASERDRARDENLSELKLTARRTRCRQINVVTAADYTTAVS